MTGSGQTAERLHAITNVTVYEKEPLARHTRFGIGGEADFLIDTEDSESFVALMEEVRACGTPMVVIGAGSNLIVSDEGFRGIVLRFSGHRMEREGRRVRVESGAVLQDLIDYCIEAGLAGLETMAGIPGWVGAAIYGNAGAYGQSISERVRKVRFCDGERLREFTQEECEFSYRESIFKRHKDWIILSAELELEEGAREQLRARADEIIALRNMKFPPTMKCAGSIFKNLLVAELPAVVRQQIPEAVIREGKVPAAYFLEQVGAKGYRLGGIAVADYHANLIYNTGEGTAAELCGVIDELKRRVRERFGLELEEEVQYVGFPGRGAAGEAGSR